MPKKKAQIPNMYMILGTLLLGAIVFVVVYSSIYYGVLRVSDKAQSSYDELAETIKSVKEGELISMPFYSDSETAVIAFDPGSDLLGFQTSDPAALVSAGHLSEWTYVGTVDWLTKNSILHTIPLGKSYKDLLSETLFQISFIPEFIKPQECNTAENAGKACICLCQEFIVADLAAGYDIGSWEPRYTCSKPHNCFSPENKDLRVVLSKSKHESVFTQNFGGYIFDRNLIMSGEEDLLKEIYIEKRGNFIYVCDHYPCAPASIKARSK